MFTGTSYASTAKGREIARSHWLSAGRVALMSAQTAKSQKPFLIVLALAFALGLAVALALCIVWRHHPNAFSAPARVAAIAVCPPFLLAAVLEATADNTLAIVMTIGTIIFANGFLYAGLASFAYFLMTVFFRKQHG